MAKYVCRIVELKNEKYDQIIEMYNTKKKIEDRIDMLEQPYRNILYFKYINGKNLTEVANIINNEYKHTCKLHGQALIRYMNLQIKEHDKRG